MTLWEEYNPNTLLGSILSTMTGLLLTQCEEKALFGALKRHLTRKELRCWVMRQGGRDSNAIIESVGLNADELEKVLQKAEKKLRQPKLQQEYRQLLAATGDVQE